jgi:hypothetical protein
MFQKRKKLACQTLITNNKKQRYQCANPNCRKAFSKPKLIKYYVCPTCQTLVIMDTKIAQLNQEIKNENDSKANENKSPRKKRKQKTELTDKKEPEPSIVIPTDQPSETSQFKLSSNLPDLEAPIPEKSPIVINSQSETAINESEKSETNEDIIRDYVKLSVASEDPLIDENSEATGDEKKSIAVDSDCNRYFGFLSQRGKGEEIPEYCFGCSKAIECMLGSDNSSNKKIEGIKQWYSSP